ncbi:N-acetylmuramoyl-L-alanine amidase [Cognatishimia sp.]|uniref:N-acetylmuramoyl-L-alanine amidase n=1 Tax=Cognatishimia sp. TaxID=2211648 RepID=UPI003513E4BD|nr:N-acetylmuramoyl-L-alanine amidase [Cognatishimia sp.]
MGPQPDIIETPSPNFGPRKGGATPSLIVVHYTAMETATAALERLCDPLFEVSAHYLISAQGEIHQLVAEDMRAWHAGAGQWGDITDVNSHSIGIELDNRGDHPFAEPQMVALEGLLSDVRNRWSIPPQNVIAHADMAPDRKFDPGPRFDWCRLAREGLSVWPDADHDEAKDWHTLAQEFGYPDMPEAHAAFRARFRPWASGSVDQEDVRILSRLLSQV